MCVMTSQCGSFENEALENEDRRTTTPNLENEDPYLETTVGLISATLRLAWRNPNQVEAADASAPAIVHKIHPKVL